MEVQVGEPGPVPSRQEFVPLREEVPVDVGLQDRRTDAELVEEVALRKRVIVLLTSLHREPDQVVGEHRVGVAIAADLVRLPLLRPSRRPREGIGRAGVVVEVIRIGARSVVRITGGIDPQTAGHAHEVADADRLTRIALALPLRNGRRLPELVFALLDEHAHQSAGEALAHRPALERRVEIDPLAVALPQKSAPVGDYESERARLRRPEADVESSLDPRPVDLRRPRLVWEEVTHRPRRRLRGRQISRHVAGCEADGVLADRVRNAPLVLVPLRATRHAVRQRERDELALVVDGGVDHMRALIERRGEAAHVGGRVLELESRDEDRRAEDLREARGVMMKRLARRGAVPGVELERGRPGDEPCDRVFRLRRLGKLACGWTACRRQHHSREQEGQELAKI